MTTPASLSVDVRVARARVNPEPDQFQLSAEAAPEMQRSVAYFSGPWMVPGTVPANVGDFENPAKVTGAGVVAARVGSAKAELAKALEHLMAEEGAGRLIYDARALRVHEYQDTLDDLFEDESVRKLVPQMKKWLAEDEEVTRLEEVASGALVVDAKRKHLAVGKAYAQKTYELTERVAKELGFTGEPKVAIYAHNVPNAWIFTADPNNPRVSFYSAMLEKYWDNDKDDWVTLWLDNEGMPTEPYAPGAKEYPVGERMVESVIAHELGHIRDDVVLTDSILWYTFFVAGEDLLKRLDDEDQKAKVRDAMSRVTQPHAHRKGFDSLVSKARKAGNIMEAEEAAGVLRRLNGAKDDGVITFEEFMDFMDKSSRVGRAGESSADFYAVALQGDAKWTALAEVSLGMDSEVESSEAAKAKSLAALIRMGPENYADAMLEELAEASTHEALDFNNHRTHPLVPVRVKQQMMFGREPGGIAQRIWDFQDSTPMEKLVTLVSLYGAKVDALQKDIAKIAPQQSYDSLREFVELQRLEGERDALKASLKKFEDLLLKQFDNFEAGKDHAALDALLTAATSKEPSLVEKGALKGMLRTVEKTIKAQMADDMPKAQRRSAKAQLERVKAASV